MNERCPTCGQPIVSPPKPKPSSALKRIRQERGLTMRELAKLAGIDTATTVWRWEHGQEINLSSAVAIADALGVWLTELLGDEEGK